MKRQDRKTALDDSAVESTVPKHKVPAQRTRGNGQGSTLQAPGPSFAEEEPVSKKKAPQPPSAEEEPKKKTPLQRAFQPPSVDDELPPWQFACDLQRDQPPVRPDIIHGLLRRSHLGVIGGTAKSKKTWLGMDLAVSVATGTEWLGFQCEKGTVVYVDNELEAPDFNERLNIILDHRQEEKLDCDIGERLIYWGFRGLNYIADEMLPLIGDRIDAENVARKKARLEPIKPMMFIFDPAYCLMGDRNENSNGEMMDFLRRFQRFGKRQDACIILPHHFAKGNQALKDAQDRFAGAGSWMRVPDLGVTFTKQATHDKTGALSVEIIPRFHAPVDAFVVTPVPFGQIMVRDTSGLDPHQLKEPGQGNQKWSDEDILMLLDDGGLRTSEWLASAITNLEMSESAFNKRRANLQARSLIRKDGKVWIRVNPEKV